MCNVVICVKMNPLIILSADIGHTIIGPPVRLTKTLKPHHVNLLLLQGIRNDVVLNTHAFSSFSVFE